MEWACLTASLVAFVASAVLFSLKVMDLLKVKRSKQNGPMLFTTMDNLRRQGFTMAAAAAILMTSVSSLNNPLPLSSQTLTLLTCLLFVSIAIAADSAFIYRRREKLALLIAIYEGKPGGLRATDPPA